MRHKYEIIALVVAWVSFLTWEYYVQQWAAQQQGGGAIIRVDLIMILPALVMLSLWMFFRIRTENNNSNKQ